MLTIIIATRNDPLLRQTISSLDYRTPIIIIDDASDQPLSDLDTGGWKDIQLIRNNHRLGPGPSRHLGASMVDGGWIMFCDSHMQFPKGWLTVVENYLGSSGPTEIWGPVYHSDVIFDSFWHDTHNVAGADFYLWRHNKENGKFSFADLLPRRIDHGWAYQVPCLLGGCYFVHSDWFKKMQGYRGLIGYGSEESWMSLSTWLMGGTVNIMGSLKVTHLYQKATASKRPLVPEWEANRLVVMKRILSPSQYEKFLSWLPIAQRTKDEVEFRCGWIDAHQTATNSKVTIHDVCYCFGLQTYEEAISLMEEHHQMMTGKTL